MFDKLKTVGTIAGLMKDKERLRDAGERVKARAKETLGTAEAGGGAVRAVANGRMEVVTLEWSPALLAAGDGATRDLAQGLMIEAINGALRAAQRSMQDVVQEEARALGLSDLPLDGLFS
ncbi:MAG: YbaB/EbfC family nucleoid-associated protein [Phycisphaeraceae bacterium]|nr:YbaB/EbfC family nucleoid-associated protein [Phycisphaeraceae bacterium]